MKAIDKSPQTLSKRNLNAIRKEITVAHGNFQSSLFRRALYKTNDKEMSQDLVQTAFLKTLMYLQRGGRIDLMRSFLNHVLNALIIDEYRKKKITSLDVLLDKGFELGSNEHERTVDIFDGKELAMLIQQLPKKYEQVLRMRYIQGFSLKEISLITGQTENTLAVQSHRGLSKLRKLYEGL